MRRQRKKPAAVRLNPADEQRVNRLITYLFTNGNFDPADRLVLMDKFGRDLGGWCKEAVRAAVVRFMVSETEGGVI